MPAEMRPSNAPPPLSRVGSSHTFTSSSAMPLYGALGSPRSLTSIGPAGGPIADNSLSREWRPPVKRPSLRSFSMDASRAVSMRFCSSGGAYARTPNNPSRASRALGNCGLAMPLM